MAWMATLARMTQVSLVAYATAGAFLGMAYFDYPYNLVLIVVACQSILAAREASPKPAVAPTAQAMPAAATPMLAGVRNRRSSWRRSEPQRVP